MEVESTSAATPAHAAAARRPIGEFLVDRGLVTKDQLAGALAEQRQCGKRLGEILVERGAITRMALASVLGEQWEEAGRHLRAVVPVRLADGKEAEGGLAGGEELTDSLAALQAAVARLEDLSSGPMHPEAAEHLVPGEDLASVEAALGSVRAELAELRTAVAAPLVVEGDLAERLEQLDSWLKERDADSGSQLAQALEALGVRVESLGATTGLGAIEAKLEELAQLVAQPHAEPPVVDLSPITGRFEQLEEALERVNTGPASAPGSEELAGRLDGLQGTIDELRTALTEPRDGDLAERLSALEQAVQARNGGAESLAARLEERLGSRDLTWEAVVERLGRLEDSLRQGLAPPDDDRLDGLAERLEALAQAVQARSGDVESVAARLEERLGGRDLDDRLEGLREAIEDVRARPSPEPAVAPERISELVGSMLDERLGQLEDSLRQTFSPGEGNDGELLSRIDELRAAVDAPRDDDLRERLASVEDAVRASTAGLSARLEEQFAQLVEELRSVVGELPTQAALESRLELLQHAIEQPRDGAVHERLDRIDAAFADPDALHEALGGLHARVESIGSEVSSANAAALAPIRDALDEIRSVSTEPPGARFLERLVARSHNQIAERIGELERTLHAPAPETGADPDAIAERDARIAELVAELRDREPTASTESSQRRPRPGDPANFLALVPAPEGYRLVALEGALPAPGEGLDVPEDERRLVVAKLGRSPYPGDARPCAYLQAV